MFFGCSGMTWEAGGVHLLGRTVDRAGELTEHRITAVGRGVKCACRLTGEEHFASGRLAYVGLTINVTKFVPNSERFWVDGVNERGLMIALLNFPTESKKNRGDSGEESRSDAVHFGRMIPHILSRCETVEMAASVLERMTADDGELQMRAHFLITDSEGESVVAEPNADVRKSGFKIYRHTDGVLTNAPEYPRQLQYLRKFRENPTMIPAAFSSTARFLRLMQIKSRAEKSETENEQDAVSKMFENLAPVTVPDGLDERKQYRTMFTVVMAAESRTYYLNSAENHRVKAVRVDEIKDGEVQEWSADGKEDIDLLN